MKPINVIMIFVVIVLLGLGAYIIYDLVNQSKANKAAIDSLYNQKQSLLSIDSIRSAIEKKIIDSVMLEFYKRDKLIKELERGIAKTRKQNEELEKRFQNITLDMPEFTFDNTLVHIAN